ncbi:KN motif and ankyrin repeat domain-containing protein 3, partial [Pygoscelis adeliae]
PPGALKSIMKKRDGPPRSEAEGSKKSLQFVGVLNGEYESTSSEEEEGDSSSEKASADSSDSEEQGDTETSDEEAREGECEPGWEHEGAGMTLPEPPEVKEKCPRALPRFELSPRMREACLIVKTHLGHPGATKSKEVVSGMLWVGRLARPLPESSAGAGPPQRWASKAQLSTFPQNTALCSRLCHRYPKTHVDSAWAIPAWFWGVCNVDHQNKAGYTALMLAALAAVEQEDDMNVVRRLFSMGNVNAKASQVGFSGLTHTSSPAREGLRDHLGTGDSSGPSLGRWQEKGGSTALMCACEHGRVETVKLLLAQPTCNISIVDSDGNNAVAIALEAGHSNIAVLLYAHLNS